MPSRLPELNFFTQRLVIAPGGNGKTFKRVIVTAAVSGKTALQRAQVVAKGLKPGFLPGIGILGLVASFPALPFVASYR